MFMDVFNKFEKQMDLSIALGFFDGVHIGHQAVINSAVQFAKKNNQKTAVVTFREHPCCYFYNVNPIYILRQEDRIKFFEKLGVDYLYLLDFDENLAKTDAEYYLKILVENLHPKSISTGFNHYFGCNKSGDIEYLRKMKNEYNYEYFEIQPQKIGDTLISSTAIRNALTTGGITEANEMLGYKFFVNGKIQEGQKIGRMIGFKTANINYPKNLIVIPNGVYAVEVSILGNIFKGIANFGIRPTVSNTNQKVLEVNILNFDKDIYGEEIRVDFLYKIRDEMKFSSIEELKLQIERDIKCLK